MVRSSWTPQFISSSEVRYTGRAPGVCSDNRAAGNKDLVAGSQDFSVKEAGAPGAQAQQEPTFTGTQCGDWSPALGLPITHQSPIKGFC